VNIKVKCEQCESSSAINLQENEHCEMEVASSSSSNWCQIYPSQTLSVPFLSTKNLLQELPS